MRRPLPGNLTPRHAARTFGACHAFAKPFESALFVQTVARVLATPWAA